MKNIKNHRYSENICYARGRKALFEYLKKIGVKTVQRDYGERIKLDDARKDTAGHWNSFWSNDKLLSVKRQNKQTYIITRWN